MLSIDDSDITQLDHTLVGLVVFVSFCYSTRRSRCPAHFHGRYRHSPEATFFSYHKKQNLSEFLLRLFSPNHTPVSFRIASPGSFTRLLCPPHAARVGRRSALWEKEQVFVSFRLPLLQNNPRISPCSALQRSQRIPGPFEAYTRRGLKRNAPPHTWRAWRDVDAMIKHDSAQHRRRTNERSIPC